LSYRSREETLEEELRQTKKDLAKANSEITKWQSDGHAKRSSHDVQLTVSLVLHMIASLIGCIVLVTFAAHDLHQGHYIRALVSALISGYCGGTAYVDIKLMQEQSK
jgi:F0F1-type ATP synthase assembly protein I